MAKGKKSGGGRAKDSNEAVALDRHVLYEAAVQNVEADLDFIERVYRRKYRRLPATLREDFCGTASMASAFAARRPKNRAFGVDLDAETLDWGLENRLRVRGVEDRVTLSCTDVRSAKKPLVDVQVAFNFSFYILPTRSEMLRYFRAVRRSLSDEGLFVVDVYGGTDSFAPCKEKTKIEAKRDVSGVEVPPFTYIWEQEWFNPVDHRMQCFIHFKVKSTGERIRKAFTYQWRMWTLVELRELLEEAGFVESKVYVEGWDEENDESDGIFRYRKKFDNEGSWISYLVAEPG